MFQQQLTIVENNMVQWCQILNRIKFSELFDLSHYPQKKITIHFLFLILNWVWTGNADDPVQLQFVTLEGLMNVGFLNCHNFLQGPDQSALKLNVSQHGF